VNILRKSSTLFTRILNLKVKKEKNIINDCPLLPSFMLISHLWDVFFFSEEKQQKRKQR